MTRQKILLIIYYVCLALILGAIIGGRYLSAAVHIDQFDTAGTALSSVCIIYTLAATFLAFSGFHALLKKRKRQLGGNPPADGENTALNNSVRLTLEKFHFNISLARMLLIASAAILCIIAFFLTVKTPVKVNNNPMMWCAAIPLIMLTFCKPSMTRYRQELDD